MAAFSIFLRKTLLLCCVPLLNSCSAAHTQPETVLVGSTPGDEIIRTILAIPAETAVDFIRWHLVLHGKDRFALDINYGESQPNTLGFKRNGEKRMYTGTFSVSESSGFKNVYHLSSADFSAEICIAKLNENVFHILEPAGNMMAGNGGWSYSLNRETPVRNSEISICSRISEDKPVQLVYEGRTPCREIANEHPEMKATASCFKIKWKLTLNRDSATHQPATCIIRNIVDNEPCDIAGSWDMIQGTAANPDAILYKITVYNLAEPIVLFAGDDNVLFFIDKNHEPMIGNQDFSFTMNRKHQ